MASETGFLFDTAGAAGRIPVFGLLERSGEDRVIPPSNCSEKHLPGAILKIVELDSIVYSDDWKAYNKLSINGFRHRWINHHNEFATGKNHINGLESFRGTPNVSLKPITVASKATPGSSSGKGRSDSTKETIPA